MKQLVVFFLLIFSPLTRAQVAQQDTTVLRSFPDTTEQILGGSVTLHVFAATGAELSWKELPEGVVELNTEYDSAYNGIHIIRKYLVLDTGEVSLPGCEAIYENELYGVEPATVKVFLLKGEGELAPDRPMEEVPFNLWWWILHYWIYFAAGAAGLLLSILLIKYLRRPKASEVTEVEPEPRDYFQEALDGLKKLKEERPWEQDEKEFYVALGDLVRVYLSHRTGLPLSEQTTTESLAMLHGKWTGAQLDAYRFIMTRADFVKFAKGKMDVSEHLDCLERASVLIAEFKPKSDVA